MAEAFIGEIRLFGFNFAPRGWMLCQGQTLAISSNSALFALIGTTYGGDGVTTFKLPDLQGRFPIGQGNGPGLSPVVMGQVTGTSSVTLTQGNLPAHVHAVALAATVSIPVQATAGTSKTPTNESVLAVTNDSAAGAEVDIYGTGPATTTLLPFAASVAGNTGVSGSSAPLSIANPSLGMSYAICLDGIFPSRN